MTFAIERLAEIGGGIVAVEGGRVLAECPLPIAGLLSDAPLADVIAQSRACNDAARSARLVGATPFLTLAFLALSVIPHLKITDRGLVDVDRFEIVRSRHEASSYAAAGSSTSDDAGTEHASGLGTRRGRVIAAVGAGAEPRGRGAGRPRRRGRHAGPRQHAPPPVPDAHPARAQEADLFSWLRELYPVWSRIDAEAEYAAARTGLAELALSGCTTVFDHHDVFPRGRTGRYRGGGAGSA